MMKYLLYPIVEPGLQLKNKVISIETTKQNNWVSNIKGEIILRPPELQISSTHNNNQNNHTIILSNIIIIVLTYEVFQCNINPMKIPGNMSSVTGHNRYILKL